jgi:hypothetical protein
VTQASRSTLPTVALLARCRPDSRFLPYLADIATKTDRVVTELIQTSKADEVVEVESMPTGSDARVCLAGTEVRRERA